MTKHGFDLEERTLEFSKKVIRFCKQLPQNVINRKLIAQLLSFAKVMEPSAFFYVPLTLPSPPFWGRGEGEGA